MSGSREPTIEEKINEVQARLHIYEGLVRALEDPHVTLDVLLLADDVDTARAALQAAFDLDEVQATAVLDLQFRRATGQQRQVITTARDELRAVSADLKCQTD